MNEWIPVAERLPKGGLFTIIFAPQGKMQIPNLVKEAYYCAASQTFSTTGYYQTRIDGVTHWMPLPNPPEEAQDE